MSIATFPATTYPRAATTPRPTSGEQGVECVRCGWYPTEWDCPCWTDIPEPERSTLKANLLTWYADFVQRNPEFDYGLA